MPTTTRILSPKTFTSINDAANAIGDRQHFDYMATINECKDTDQFHAENADELAYDLDARGFDSDRGDTVQVWLPQESGADMLDAS